VDFAFWLAEFAHEKAEAEVLKMGIV